MDRMALRGDPPLPGSARPREGVFGDAVTDPTTPSSSVSSSESHSDDRFRSSRSLGWSRFFFFPRPLPSRASSSAAVACSADTRRHRLHVFASPWNQLPPGEPSCTTPSSFVVRVARRSARHRSVSRRAHVLVVGRRRRRAPRRAFEARGRPRFLSRRLDDDGRGRRRRAPRFAGVRSRFAHLLLRRMRRRRLRRSRALAPRQLARANERARELLLIRRRRRRRRRRSVRPAPNEASRQGSRHLGRARSHPLAVQPAGTGRDVRRERRAHDGAELDAARGIDVVVALGRGGGRRGDARRRVRARVGLVEPVVYPPEESGADLGERADRRGGGRRVPRAPRVRRIVRLLHLPRHVLLHPPRDLLDPPSPARQDEGSRARQRKGEQERRRDDDDAHGEGEEQREHRREVRAKVEATAAAGRRRGDAVSRVDRVGDARAARTRPRRARDAPRLRARDLRQVAREVRRAEPRRRRLELRRRRVAPPNAVFVRRLGAVKAPRGGVARRHRPQHPGRGACAILFRVGPRFRAFWFSSPCPTAHFRLQPTKNRRRGRTRAPGWAFSTKQPDPAVTTRSAVDPRSVEARNPNVMACVAQIHGVPAAAAPRLSLLGNRRAGASPRPEDSRPIVAPPGWI